MREQTAREALDILRMIQLHFDSGAQQVYACALLFEDESTLQDHVNRVVTLLDEELNPQPVKPVVPRSKRRKIHKSVWGNWNGYLGKRKVIEFGTNDDAAHQWFNKGEEDL